MPQVQKSEGDKAMASKAVRSAIAAICALVLVTSFPVDASAANESKRFRAVKTFKQEYKENWALDRINQVRWKLDGKKLNNSQLGAGITIYVIDTGVGQDDCHGHGTVVASMASGDLYGVAPLSDAVSVKALDCDGSGSASDVIKAVKWVQMNADPESSVVNMSLGGNKNESVDSAVSILAEIIPVVVAAGNESTDACHRSPARVPAAITVAGYDRNNLRSIFSNFGTCIDIWAPGTAIDGIEKDGSRVQWSGTSMSTALVSGAIAFIASRDSITTKQAAAVMMSEASRPYLIDARLVGVSAYAVFLRD